MGAIRGVAPRGAEAIRLLRRGRGSPPGRPSPDRHARTSSRIAQSFYDRIREHEDAHAVFTGEAQIERLQRSLQRWLDRLLSGSYDEAYFLETLQIGRVHVRVGLPQRYMLTAMALIRLELTRLCAQAW